MEILFGLKNDGTKYCQYDTKELPPDDTNIYTIKELSNNEVQEIVNCTPDEVQKLLDKYI